MVAVCGDLRVCRVPRILGLRTRTQLQKSGFFMPVAQDLSAVLDFAERWYSAPLKIGWIFEELPPARHS